MCGIAGVVGPGAGHHEALVRKMVGALAHRGPDDSGVAVFDDAVLGSARLSIIDPEGGHQPLSAPGSGTNVVCNGEIYGHHRIRRQFADHPFRTGSDCEVVLPLHERYGDDLLPHLPGTFALAVWDDRHRSLLLARDRFGERPLYYALLDDGLLAFASESRALVAAGLVEPRPDPESVAHMLRQGYLPPDRSIWHGVNSLPHASRLRWTRETGPRVDRWWSAPALDRDVSQREAVEWFRTELDRAVQDQLESDVPIGALLSGGIDSTTIAALAARHHPDLHAFTFDMPGDSELEFARASAERHGINLHVFRPDTSRLVDDLQAVASVWDEPFGDSSALPTNLLCRFVREHVTVALTGDGADELLGGYLVWTRPCLEDDDPASGRATVAPQAARGQRLRGAAKRLLGRGANGNGSAAAGGSAVARRYSTFRQYFDGGELRALGLPGVDAAQVDLSAYRYGSADDISRFDLDHYLPGDILVKTDRASMAHSLEVRSPFLDVAVAEGCLRLPSHHKVDADQEKLLLRRSFGDLWPADVANRRKQGFGSPMSEWLALPDVAALKHAHLVDPASPLFDLVEHAPTQAHVAGDDQRTWNLLMLSLWWTRCRSEVAAR